MCLPRKSDQSSSARSLLGAGALMLLACAAAPLLLGAAASCLGWL
jgi:hypothetical protein